MFDDPERIAKGLGWFSIGLGLAEIAKPRGMARMIGVDDREKSRDAMFAVGMREIASGIGILTRPRPTGWVWARVGGDVMDLAALGSAYKSPRANRNRIAAAAAAVLGVTLLDVFTGQELSRESGAKAGARARGERGVHVTQAITINRSAEELYRFWRNFENLPRFMEYVESVQPLDDRRSHWRVRTPAGVILEWDSELIDDQPNRLIAWRSLEGADIPNSGVVRFVPAPGNRGTEVHVELNLEPPGGRIGARLAKPLGAVQRLQVTNNLRRFKQLMETGEIIQSEASIHRRPHPAQPPEEPVAATQTVEGGAR